MSVCDLQYLSTIQLTQQLLAMGPGETRSSKILLGSVVQQRLLVARP